MIVANQRPNPQKNNVAPIFTPQELELQRLAEFGRLSAFLIHDLSTPLTAAVITLEQLLAERPNKLIKQASRDLKQLERYVVAAKNQLRGESKLSSFSLTIAIHQVIMLLSGRAQHEQVKVLAKTIGSVYLRGDKAKFQQIMANLINNAIESYEGISSRAKIIEVNVVLTKDNQVSITVLDHGKGIKSKDLAKIFNAFYSTKKTIHRGLGLGLVSVKQFVEHDFRGRILVKSEPGDGTSFNLLLPL